MNAETEPITVLLVEDDERDYLITRELLAEQRRANFMLDWCETYADALMTIRERRHDVYLIDYRLGERTGLDLLGEAIGRRSHPPVIVLTGRGEHDVDLAASELGVTDYLLKHELDSVALERSIHYAISHRRALDELASSRERYALAMRAANEGIWDWDLSANVLYFSPRWHAVLGHREHATEASLSEWLELVHDEDLPRLRAAIDAHLAGKTPHLQVEYRMRHADGTWRWVLTRGLATRTVGGRPTRMAGSLSDITDQRAAELQLQHDALHDTLTGLPNRALFMDRVNQVLQRSKRDAEIGCAVLFVDIDRFKLVNDTLSHTAGDQLLIEVAGRIAGLLRPGDTVARIGGDEFTVLLFGTLGDREALVVAERIQGVLAEPLMLEGHELRVTASIGVSRSSHGISAAELLRDADIAMYEAKRRGQGRCATFTDPMRKRVVDRLARETDLRRAVEQGLLEVHYQPIVDLVSGAIYGIEALARWPHGWQPEVQPIEFIKIAEETGAIYDVGFHVLRAALEQFGGWRRAGVVPDRMRISVNISSRQLDEPHLPREVRAAIKAAELAPEALRLEITESTLMQEPERIRRIVSELCDTGVGLYLDDFGTGYSSLAALHRMPVDALKIDRSFVTSPAAEGGDPIVEAIVAIADSLRIDVIAEGIERAEQRDRMRDLGCGFGQGYLFSRPLHADRMEALLTSWSASESAGLPIE